MSVDVITELVLWRAAYFVVAPLFGCGKVTADQEGTAAAAGWTGAGG